MKLSLSGRLFELPGATYSLPLEEFLSFAKQTGYAGVEIRYPQLPFETPPDRRVQLAQHLQRLGLAFVFGTVEGIADDTILERAKSTLAHNAEIGALFTKFTVAQPEHIPAAQQLADAAAGNGAKLILQIHIGTLHDNVPRALDLLKRIDRPNVGLAYEACHLVFDGDQQYLRAPEALGRHLFTVLVQNYKPAPADAPADQRLKIGAQEFVRALPGDPDGIDFAAVTDALKKVGYDGFITVMCDPFPGLDHRDAALRWYQQLQPLV
ncbi:sugar phosphate isomerase/epimerase [bacterium]|nr:sugar phosphate isomerase/epimerase [bacterium]